ncbi:MAG: major facilitator superfamily domain-containing protein, partial [Benniella sp.]
HWLVLTLACLLLLGNYYCYDIPGALNVQLREWLGTDYAAHQYYLNLLYSVYSLPNIVLPLMGGVLIDHLSASKMLLIFSLFVCGGQGIFAIGVSTKSIWTMILGRLIFGIGGECLEVAQAKITTDWFKARWLGFALGLNLSFARIGTALNDNISPVIATGGGGVVAASWVGFVICGLSLAAGIWLSHLDGAESRRSAGVRLDVSYKRSDRIQSRTDNIIGRHALNASSDSTMSMSSVALEEEDEIEKDDEMAQDDRMLISEVFTLQPNFWVLSLCCITLYGAVVPFIHVSSDFLQKKWYANNPTKAGASIPDIVSAIGSPLCGYLVDQFGYRARYIPLSALLLIWAHVQLGFTLATPIMAMFILGLAYSLFASVLWPCIPFLVKDHQLGTAYGLVTIALNISLTIFPLVVASILEATQGSYTHVEGLFIGLAFTGLLLSILFNVLDYRQG